MTIEFALTVLTSCLLLVPAAAQEPKVSVRDIVTLVGTVEGIVQGSRTLTVQVDNSFKQSLYVPPEFKVFEELKVGDRIVARIRESVVVSARPGLKPKILADTTAEAARKAQTAQQLTAVVTIESIDRATNWVTYKTADNRRVIRAVADPGLLDGLKPGDVIEVTLTRERVIELERR
jgi:hypothetical protein